MIIIGLKLNHLFLWLEDANRSLTAMHNKICRQFLPKCPWSCLTVPSQSSKRRVAAEKPSDFFHWIKEELNLRISSCLWSLIVPPKSISAVKTRLLWQPLRRYISRSHNLFIEEVTDKKKNRLYTRKLKPTRLYLVTFPLDLYLILWYFRPLHDVNFEIENITQTN